MNKKWDMDRRKFLKCTAGGASTLIALPFLEIFSFKKAFASGSPANIKRSIFTYSAHGGANTFWPTLGSGAGMNLAGSAANELAAHKSYLRFLSGTRLCDNPYNNGFGHNRSYFSGVLAAEDATTNSPSVDQIIQNNLVAGGYTGQSLHVAGYSIDSTALFATSGGAAIPQELNPLNAFNSVTSGYSPSASATEVERRKAQGQSVLDSVLADINHLSSKILGASDRHRLDEYTTGIRDLETKIQSVSAPDGSCTLIATPSAQPMSGTRDIANDYEITNAQLMCDIIVMALQCDFSRVVTFPFSMGWSHNFQSLILDGTQLGFPQTYHGVNHRNPVDIPISASACEVHVGNVDRLHLKMLDYLLTRLRSVDEGGSNLLDNTFVVYGSELGCGPLAPGHSQFGNACIVAGNTNSFTADFHASVGGFSTAYQFNGGAIPNETRLANIWLSIIQAMGGSQTSFANSRGTIDLNNGNFTAT